MLPRFFQINFRKKKKNETKTSIFFFQYNHDISMFRF